MNPNKTETNEEAAIGKRTRKRYTEAFKTKAVPHYERHAGDIHRTAVELGIHPWPCATGCRNTGGGGDRRRTPG